MQIWLLQKKNAVVNLTNSEIWGIGVLTKWMGYIRGGIVFKGWGHTPLHIHLDQKSKTLLTGFKI